MSLTKLTLFTVAILLTACKASLTSDPVDLRAGAESTWPVYETKAVSGRLFGDVWTGQTAIARANLNDANEMVLEIYGEEKLNACDGPVLSSKPFVSVHIPKAYTVAEYKDPQRPMVFTSISTTARNVIASRTAVRIDSLSSQGFTASLTADGLDELGVVYEMNGQINVTDCSKVVPFSAWEKLVDNYKLYSFDGVAQDMRLARLTLDQQSFFDRTTQTYKKSVLFPLYYSVSQGSDATYNFGPIDGKGVTEIAVNGQQTTYTYQFEGPITFRDVDLTEKLNITVIKYFDEIEVRYTIEVPGHIPSASHKFILKK